VNRFKRVIITSIAVGLTAGLSSTAAAASVHSPRLSSLVVPPPHGLHSNPTDPLVKLKTGPITIADAVKSGCYGPEGDVLSTTPRSEWLGTDLRYYTSAHGQGDLRICVTSISAAAEAHILETVIATPYKDGAFDSPSVKPLKVSGIPHATGTTFSVGGKVEGVQVTFERGRYVVFMIGEYAAARFVPSLAREQYVRLR
jgi:hypothetical protein